MKNKKLIALLICAAMSLATAVGCGGSTEDSSSQAGSIPSSQQTSSEASEEVVESSEEIVESSEEIVESSEETIESSEAIVESSEETIESSEAIVESSEETIESSEEIVESSEEIQSSEEVESSEEEPEVTYTVTFDGADVEAQTVVEGGVATKPADPVKEYYTFIGWYNGETAWNFEADTITGDITLTAKFEAKVYVVKFVDFEGEETEATYTYENVINFIFPAAPTAPEHYENARWNMTQEECLVYSEEPIVVEAIADAKVYTVSFDTNGAEAMDSIGVTYGDALVIANVPTLDGYMFKSWTLNGEDYDTSALVTGDITLKATWYADSGESSDSVISAEYIDANAQFEAGYVSKTGAVANPNAGWYFDSDYNGTNGNGGTVENQFANWVAFGVTADGGAGNVPEGRDTYIVLPAFNYAMYSKVDVAYRFTSSSIKAITICGTEVAQYGGQNKLITIVTDENGTKLYFREINSVPGDVTVGADAVIDLPESVANGSEGLKLNITATAYSEFHITEYHVTTSYIDYNAIMAEALAKLPASVEELTGSKVEMAAVLAYVAAEQYLTSAERVGYTTPAIIGGAQEVLLYTAVLNAAAGSDEQGLAIAQYSDFVVANPDKRNEAHIAEINAIVNEHFFTVQEEILLNDPIVDTSKGAVDQNERIQNGWGGHHTEYNTTYETYVHMIQYASGDFDGTITLPVINYNALAEAYFGLFAMSAGNGTITIAGQSFSFDNSKGHSFKVTIKNGVLSMVDDSKTQNDGGVEIFSATLPAEVANGTTGLVIDCNFDAWSQVEVTEMHTTKEVIATIKDVYDNAVALELVGTTQNSSLKYEESSYWGNGAHTAFNTEYTKQNLVSFNAQASAYNATFTLPTFDFTQYDQTYFGFTAATAEGNCTLTIGGQSYTYDLNQGYVYIKVLIRDNTLTLIGDGVKNAGNVLMSVELSENVLNGSEALTLTWSTAGWSQVEITEVHAITEVKAIS